MSIQSWWSIGRSPKISPNVQSGDRSHPASMMSGVMRKVRTPIPRLRKLIIELIVASSGCVVLAVLGVAAAVVGASAWTVDIPCTQPISICTWLFVTLSSLLVINNPVQKTDNRSSRDTLERRADENISCVFFNKWVFLFLLLLHHMFLFFAKVLHWLSVFLWEWKN